MKSEDCSGEVMVPTCELECARDFTRFPNHPWGIRARLRRSNRSHGAGQSRRREGEQSDRRLAGIARGGTADLSAAVRVLPWHPRGGGGGGSTLFGPPQTSPRTSG